MKEILRTGSIMVRENLNGLILNLNIRVNLKKVKCMAKAYLIIPMVSSRVNLKMAIWMVKDKQLFLMEINTPGNFNILK